LSHSANHHCDISIHAHKWYFGQIHLSPLSCLGIYGSFYGLYFVSCLSILKHQHHCFDYCGIIITLTYPLIMSSNIVFFSKSFW
jgi:hypothetical protein